MPRPKSGGGHKGGAGRGSVTGFMRPLKPSSALAEIVGGEPLPRTEATKRVWVYIRHNNLQDPEDKRRIIADHKLRMVFNGKPSISIFELPKHLALHLGGDGTTDPGD
jgi:upstream activation factor subunit UAF30